MPGYESLFSGIGTLKDKVIKLHVDKSVKPVRQPHRRIPYHIRMKVEDELEKLERLDIIERVDGPTPWVSPIVAVPKKDGSIRICVDMREANKAIQRERHLTPTLDDILNQLNGACVFSKLDLNAGYHQLLLDVDSRQVTTFTTHVGLRRYKRLNFGINSAAEVFQEAIREMLDGLDGVLNVSDDILVYGESTGVHESRLVAVLDRIKSCGVTLNASKCELRKDVISFFGHIFSKDGVTADPSKIESIKNMKPPQTKEEIRSLLGMTNYVSRFISCYSTVTEPLRRLTKNDVPWEWTKIQEDALKTLKESLTSIGVMAYFNEKKETTVYVDAGPVGIAAMLTQDGKVISYASRALTDVEQRYSQTEKEGLSVVWACEHYHLFLYGDRFTLVTDHKPLEAIFNNPRSKPPARIQRWALRLQPYDYVVKYKKGENNPADYLSRHPLEGTFQMTVEQKAAEEYVNFLSDAMTPKTVTIDEVKQGTITDNVLKMVVTAIKENSWENFRNSTMTTEQRSRFNSFYKVRHELTVNAEQDMILRGARLIIPKELEVRVIEIAHEGHLGLVKTKQLIREKTWFPGIDDLTNKLVKQCLACLCTVPDNSREDYKMSDLPHEAWTEVSMDFKSLPNGEYFLVITDDYSRYPVVELISSNSARVVIPVIDRIFGMFGVPKIVKSDNGSPFQSREFKQFSHYLGFKHRRITPYWPRANAECERFMKTIGKTIKASTVQGSPWKQDLYRFLRNYRATPHPSTGVPPATAMFNRPMKVRLPQLSTNIESNMKESMVKRDREQKEKMRKSAFNKNVRRQHGIQQGSQVVVKDIVKGVLRPFYVPKVLTVSAINGTMITAERGGKAITRNETFFKLVSNPTACQHTSNRVSVDEPMPLVVRHTPSTPEITTPAAVVGSPAIQTSPAKFASTQQLPRAQLTTIPVPMMHPLQAQDSDEVILTRSGQSIKLPDRYRE
jgi:glutaredoxin-related protein